MNIDVDVDLHGFGAAGPVGIEWAWEGVEDCRLIGPPSAVPRLKVTVTNLDDPEPDVAVDEVRCFYCNTELRDQGDGRWLAGEGMGFYRDVCPAAPRSGGSHARMLNAAAFLEPGEPR